MLTEPELTRLAEKAEAKLQLLSKIVLMGKTPIPGAYAFFHYSAHAIIRLQDCRRIVGRLYAGRRRLTELHRISLSCMELEKQKKPIPKEVMLARRELAEVEPLMKLDLETLYMIGTILLDQWALQALCIGSLASNKKYPFSELLRKLEEDKAGPLDTIWDRLRENILWLYYQLRFYRNKFVVHANRPWQRGTTASLRGLDFNLFMPTPPGWIDDEKANKEIMELIDFAPEHIRRAPASYWEKKNPRRLIEVVFDNIGTIEDRKTRERVADLFAQVGGSTPTFQRLAGQLFEFIEKGTELLIDISNTEMDRIDLGKPFKNGRRMLEEDIIKSDIRDKIKK